MGSVSAACFLPGRFIFAIWLRSAVSAYTRTGTRKTALVVLNFSDQQADIAPEINGRVTMLLNTNWEPFGGKEKRSAIHSIPLKIAPFSGMIFAYNM